MEREEHLIDIALPLARGEQLHIDDGRELLIHVWQGRLHLRLPGASQGLLLATGQSFRIDRDGLVRATAGDDAVLALTSPRATAPARRMDVVPAQHAVRAPSRARAAPHEALAHAA